MWSSWHCMQVRGGSPGFTWMSSMARGEPRTQGVKGRCTEEKCDGHEKGAAAGARGGGGGSSGGARACGRRIWATRRQHCFLEKKKKTLSHLWRAVEARLDVGVDGARLEARRAKINQFNLACVGGAHYGGAMVSRWAGGLGANRRSSRRHDSEVHARVHVHAGAHCSHAHACTHART